MVELAAPAPPATVPAFRPGTDILADFLARPLHTALDAYRSCGPVARARFGGEDVVLLMGREANEVAWSDSGRWDYARSNVAFAEELTVDHLDATSGLRHWRRRSVMNPAFAREAVLADLPVLAERLAAEVPPAAAAGPVDFLRFWMELLTRHRAATAVRADLDDATVAAICEWQFQFIHGITLGQARHAHYARPGYVAVREVALGTFRRLATERLAQLEPGGSTPSATPGDELAGVLERRGRLEPVDGLPTLDLDAVTDDVYLLLVAGVDNVQAVVIDLFRQFAVDPDLAERLRAELAGWDGRDPTPLQRGPWWTATLTELHRLRPQVPATTATTLFPVEDVTFAGHTIAAGTPVLHPMVLTQVLEEFYPDPFAFRPERFLDGRKPVPGTFGAFGGGVHRCIGRSVGNLQGALIAAHLLVGYDVEGLPPPDPDLPVGDRATKHLQRLPVTLRPRRPPP